MEAPRKPSPLPPAGAPARARRLLWLRRLEERIWSIPDGGGLSPQVFGKRLLQVVDRSVRGFIANHGLTYASALTYTSLLAMVPLFAIILAVLKGFGVDEMARNTLAELPIIKQATFMPGQSENSIVMPLTAARAAQGATSTTLTGVAVSGPQIVEMMIDTVTRTNLSSLGFLGVGSLLLLVISLLSQIEKAMNEAWSIYRSRNFGRKLADYMNLLMVVLLLLVGLSALGTNKAIIWFQAFKFGGVPGLGYAWAHLVRLVSYFMVFAAFVFMYFYIPNTRVRWRSAAVGGFAAAFTFYCMQSFFVFFQGHLLGARVRIYGAFGSIMLILFYIYLFWCIVLWGVEVSSAHQNLRDWRRRRRKWLGLPAERETLALRLAALLARPLLGAEDPALLDLGGLADRLNLPPLPVAEMLEIFRAGGLVVQTSEDCTYMLGRSPEEVPVLDVLRLVRSGSMRVGGVGGDENPAVCNIDVAALGPLARQTVKDLAGQSLEAIQTINF